MRGIFVQHSREVKCSLVFHSQLSFTNLASTMGLWSHLKRNEPPAPVASAASTSPVDPEKSASHDPVSPPATSAEHHPFPVEVEKAVVKKLDRNVVLLVSFLFLLSFLDRSNIGELLPSAGLKV